MSDNHPLEEFIRQLDIAGKSLSMYSEGHPSSKMAFDQAFALVQEALQSRPVAVVSVIGSDILVDGEPVRRSDRAVERFVKTLDARLVRSLSFHRGVTREDLVMVLKVLNMTPQKIRDLGGIEAVLESHGITSVQANKVRYGIVGEGAGSHGGGVSMSVDEGLMAQLLATVQLGVSGQSDFHTAAQNVERSLDGSASPDSSAVLFRLFQGIAQGSQVEPSRPLKESFLEMFRSFTPKMQGKLLLTAILNRTLLDQSSLSGFYYDLKAEEWEAPILGVLLLEQVSDQDLRSFVAALENDAHVVLPESIRQKFIQRGFIKLPEPEPEDVRSKAVMEPDDYSKLMDAIRQDLAAGKVDEVDRASKRLLGGLNATQADHRLAAGRLLPAMVEELSRHEKWKYVETSVSFVAVNCFKKETDDAVLDVFAGFLVAGFRKKYEQKDLAGCKEFFATVSARSDKKEVLAGALGRAIPELAEAFRKDLAENAPSADSALEYLRHAGVAGADFMLEWLAVEEDQRMRSRIIAYTERLDQKHLLPEMEKRLDDSRWYVVRNMVTITGRLNLPHAVPFMSRAMENPDIRVAKEVVKALFKSISPANSPLVMALLQNPDKSVRLQALRLVTLFGLEKEQARSTLQKMAATDPVPEVRTLASSILG